jgi:integrase
VPRRRCAKCNGDTAKWAFVVDVGKDLNDRRQQRLRTGFATRKEAEHALRQLLSSLDEHRYVQPSKTTLEHYLTQEWLPARKPTQRSAGRGHRGQLSLGTWENYHDYMATIIPRVGSVPLQDLTFDMLNRLYDHLEERGGRNGQGLSTKTVANIHGVLHKALKDAVKRGKVPRNVADAVDPPKADRPTTDVWDVDQLRAFLAHVVDADLYAAWLLFATTGMRRGEVAGLAWEDVDLDGGTVRVDWTLGVVENKATWKPRAKSAAGNRVMALDPATVDALRARREHQEAQRARIEPRWREHQADWRGEHRDELVFTWPDGTLIHPQRYSDWFAKHCAEAGLPRIRLHDVRHTYASVALARSTDWHEIKVISERLGHASIGITLDTYAHVLPVADERTAHTLASHILGHT